jgi:hypothetical protein
VATLPPLRLPRRGGFFDRRALVGLTPLRPPIVFLGQGQQLNPDAGAPTYAHAARSPSIARRRYKPRYLRRRRREINARTPYPAAKPSRNAIAISGVMRADYRDRGHSGREAQTLTVELTCHQ